MLQATKLSVQQRLAATGRARVVICRAEVGRR
jgi:hypothetical protein